MVKHNKLGKVICQIGGFRIRKTTRGFGAYCGKKLWEECPDLDIIKAKVTKLQADIANPKPGPYVASRLKVYKTWLNR